MNRKIILIIACVAALLAVGATVGIIRLHSGERSHNNEDEYPTDTNFTFDEDAPKADPTIVGKWQNTDNPQWYKVFYDDYDDEGYFWGKEWNEYESVYEEDLAYHGNGWFRWRKDGDQLVEMHTMDIHDIPIPKIWVVKYIPARAFMSKLLRRELTNSSDMLVLTDFEFDKQCYRFMRVQE